MNRNTFRGVGSSLLLLLWLLLVQFLSSLLSVIFITILGISHPAGPTPLWQWTLIGVLICLFWLGMGAVTPNVIQLRLAGAAALLVVWALATSWMRNAYLLFLPQSTCGGMLRQMVQLLFHGFEGLLDPYQDLPVGCFALSAVFGAGLLFRRIWTETRVEVSEKIVSANG